MNILNQNLTEGQAKKVEQKPVHRVSNTVSKAQVKRESQTFSRTQTRTSATINTKEDTKKPKTTIKFSFTMDSFIIDLLTTPSTGVSILKYLMKYRSCGEAISSLYDVSF